MFMYMMKKDSHVFKTCNIVLLTNSYNVLQSIIKTLLDLQNDLTRHPVEKLQYSFEQLHSNVHFNP